jgi:hypothetical protein
MSKYHIAFVFGTFTKHSSITFRTNLILIVVLIKAQMYLLELGVKDVQSKSNC